MPGMQPRAIGNLQKNVSGFAMPCSDRFALRIADRSRKKYQFVLQQVGRERQADQQGGTDLNKSEQAPLHDFSVC